MEAGSPHANYAIVDDSDGFWAVNFRAVCYDWEAAARAAEAHERPDIARALRTGCIELPCNETIRVATSIGSAAIDATWYDAVCFARSAA